MKKIYRFYLPTVTLYTGELTKDITHHAKVLHLHQNDLIELFDGNGNIYKAQITSLNKIATIKIVQHTLVTQMNFKTILAVSYMAKLDLIVQKATELGVSAINILQTTNSQVAHNMPKKLLHWRNIVISSAQQCGLHYLPQVIYHNNLQKWLIDIEESIQFNKFILLADNIQHSKIDISERNNNYLLVGPEGGFTTKEIALCMQYQFKPVKLGSLTLRSETAVISALAILHNTFNDWSNIK